MNPTEHQIAISYVSSIPSTDFDEFFSSVHSEDLDLSIEQREKGGPYASMAWYIASAVFIWIGKSYFEPFLKEMGKEHYLKLKGGLGKFWGKFLGPSSTQMELISASGELLQDNTYSLNYSILAEADLGRRFKLLFHREISEEEYQQALDEFLAFLYSYHEGTLNPEILHKLEGYRVMGNTILMTYDPVSRAMEFINPIPDRLRLSQ